MRNFRELKIWQMGYDLALEVYRISSSFPESEKFGITNQIRRSSTSIPTNICEGCGRESDKDFKHFLHIALGSSYETECHLMISRDLGYLEEEDFKKLHSKAVEVEKSITNFIKALE